MDDMCVGSLHKSKTFGDFEIVEYNNHRNVVVKFISTGYTTIATANNIRKGLVKDKLMPFVKGVGYCSVLTVETTGTPLKSYRVWSSMLTRCYDTSYQRNFPAYIGCSVSEGFKDFSLFKRWYDSQQVQENYVLDKDILIKGNRVYSEDTCCFVPQEINLLFVSKKANRGEYPVGVTKVREQKYRARLNKGNGVNVHLGYYSTPEDAFYAYKEAKEAYIKEVAEKWKDQIDPRVYEALMNWEVDITD